MEWWSWDGRDGWVDGSNVRITWLDTPKFLFFFFIYACFFSFLVDDSGLFLVQEWKVKCLRHGPTSSSPSFSLLHYGVRGYR